MRLTSSSSFVVACLLLLAASSKTMAFQVAPPPPRAAALRMLTQQRSSSSSSTLLWAVNDKKSNKKNDEASAWKNSTTTATTASAFQKTKAATSSKSSIKVDESSLLDAFEDFQNFLKNAGGGGSSSSDSDDSDNVGVIDSSPPTDTAVVATTTTTTTASTTSAPTVPATTTPNTMHPHVFTFNKVMIDTIYNIVCFLYPVNGTSRDFARFYVLETVARVPYFAYLTVLHFRETFGDRTNLEKMRTHYAEADNELHHLLIMESLGGNDNGLDRVVAQTMSFFYFWYVILVYSMNEAAAYHLSELIEAHAYRTYDGFTTNYKEILQQQAVPEIAKKYYERDDPYLFDLVCRVREGTTTTTNTTPSNRRRRRPKLENLYDVFLTIRDDEGDHWKTLCNLVQYSDMNAVDNASVKATEMSK